MMPWNRKEVWMGANAQKFSEIKNALAHSQIEYAYDIKSSAGRVGRLGALRGTGFAAVSAMPGSPERDQLYYVYVHKYDSDKAWKVLRKLIG